MVPNIVEGLASGSLRSATNWQVCSPWKTVWDLCRKKCKYRVVFQGNRVVDHNMDEAQFQDMGSAPATIEASRMCIMKGLFAGKSVGQADAMQAYIQAKLGGAETWVEIPEEGWPPEWIKNGPPCERPCCRLI